MLYQFYEPICFNIYKGVKYVSLSKFRFNGKSLCKISFAFSVELSFIIHYVK